MKKITFLLFLILCFSINAQYAKLHDFIMENNLENPYYSELVTDGTWLYGMCSSGGNYNRGAIFKIKIDGSGYTKLHDFGGYYGSEPYGSLALSGSILYGMTNKGGIWDEGVIFKINTDGSGYYVIKDLHSFEGINPYGSLAVSDSTLYGMTNTGGNYGRGTIFKIDYHPFYGYGDFSTILDFDSINGSNPYGSLTLSGDLLYGMTRAGGSNDLGVAFKIKTSGMNYTKLHDFDTPNGRRPYGTLRLQGSILYGATAGGGPNSSGVIFKMNTDGSNYTRLLDFNVTNGKNPYGSVFLKDTFIYVTTQYGGLYNLGALISVKTNGTGYQKLYDFDGSTGSYPVGSLIMVNSVLFGMTWGGGSAAKGVMFQIHPDGTQFSLMMDFSKAPGGNYPHWSQLATDSTWLYGLTTYGGLHGMGVLYKIKTNGSEYTDLLDFDGVNTGSNPYSSVLVSGSTIYGTTTYGGANNMGLIFKIGKDGTGFTKLYEFAGSDGAYPYGCPLIKDGNILYGMTNSGGTYDYGVIYQINDNGSGFQKLLDFDQTNNGSYPFGALTLYEGQLYGSTPAGGAGDDGTIFRINTDGSGYKKIADMEYYFYVESPNGSLVISESTIYGMASTELIGQKGGIFNIATDGYPYNDLFIFNDTTGMNPEGSLTLADTTFFGLTGSGGEYNKGVLFKINKSGGGYKKLVEFDRSISGAFPYGTLTFLNCNLYGVTQMGGAAEGGVIFKYNLLPAITKQSTPYPGLCPGDRAGFSVAASPSNDVTYQWQVSKNGGTDWDDIITEGSYPKYSNWLSDSLIIDSVAVENNGFQYRCKVFSIPSCWAASDPVILTVNGPVLISQPVSVTVNSGQSTSFKVNTGGKDISLMWLVSTNGGSAWDTITSAGSNPVYSNWMTDSLQLSQVTEANNGFQYRCVVTGDCNISLVSNPATLTVNPTGIDKFSNSAGRLFIYPNPLKDEFEIRFKNEKKGQVLILLYNKLGEIVMQSGTNKDSEDLLYKLNVSSLPEGTYFIEVRVKQESIGRSKISIIR